MNTRELVKKNSLTKMILGLRQESKNCWVKYIASKPKVNEDIEREVLATVERDGCTVIPGFLSEAECDAIVDDMETGFAEEGINVWKDDEGSDSRLFGLEHLSERAKNFIEHPSLFRIAKSYLRREQLYGFTMGGLVRFIEGNIGSGGGWHRDTPNHRQIKAIVYLSDAKKENGAFQYIPRTHTIGSNFWDMFKLHYPFNKSRFTEEEIEKLVGLTDRKVRTIEGKKGDVLIVDTRGIHRGAPLRVGERYALTSYYIEEPDYIDHFDDLMVKPIERSKFLLGG
jgi:hypothetical protein